MQALGPLSDGNGRCASGDNDSVDSTALMRQTREAVQNGVPFSFHLVPGVVLPGLFVLKRSVCVCVCAFVVCVCVCVCVCVLMAGLEIQRDVCMCVRVR